ncbi:MAG: hypothetical protein K2P88_07270 [Chitinophagaceae bacterium]|uniref:hypothetical protein n=1 Tax=unclassified Paraflavitalea TaxID=2798305 RepID=UPI003D33116A|nr:hypothetical protein [Chitinophagaceae bacterium]
MSKAYILGIIPLLIAVCSFGQLGAEDYVIYGSIIRTEIRDSSSLAVILRNGIDSLEKSVQTRVTIQQLNSSNLSDRQQVYMWTENRNGQRPTVIDSSLTKLLANFYGSNNEKVVINNNFSHEHNTLVVKRFPIRQKHIQQDWIAFYERYPNAAGIFSFSRINYYLGNTTAIVCYWVKRNGLNGHGALAVLKKSSDTWEVEYKIYLWHN